MTAMESFVTTSGLRSALPPFDLGATLQPRMGRDHEWREEGFGEAVDGEVEASFLVADQCGVASSGAPIFGTPQRSDDDNLVLSEDGFLINGQGRFVLGLPLDGNGRRAGRRAEILRIDASPMPPTVTDWLVYRVNLPSFPLTANAEFDVPDSELLDRTPYARDPSAQGSGIVLGDDRVKFQARSISGGSVMVHTRDGLTMPLVLRWAKVGSLRTVGCDMWNLFYRVRRDPRGGELAWKNAGHTLCFEGDGRLSTTAQSLPIFDVQVDGTRLGNLSLIFGAGGITQFADRAGLVKVQELRANGSAGGAFAGISMSSRGRLFAHYTDGATRPVADVFLPEETQWQEPGGREGEAEMERSVA